MKTVRELLRDKRFIIGAAVFLIFAVLAILSFFSPHDPTEWHTVGRNLRPSLTHPLGTSFLGQDVFWRMTFAVRNSLILAILASAISRAIAVVVGLVAGYYGGIVDRLVMLVSDGFMVIPGFLLIVLLTLLAREFLNLVTIAVLLGVIGWAWSARLVRSQILSLREREFTFTAILSGTPARKLIFREYFPFILPLVFATFIAYMAYVIGIEITLTILGLTSPNMPTLGSMLHWALTYQALLSGYWWWYGTPIAVSVLLFVALYLTSVSISAYLDPRARLQRVGAG